ncbi:MAG: SDR family NAD(P)-dependent oxidoreductase, partial [Gammaproteobacteria bacterium]|nr:SDR family NAD(P)-dependent oxidoreductase [Gammaproteobacteria bacterium]
MTEHSLLKDKLVLVTGAGGAIGAAVCKAFQDHGAQCIGVDASVDESVSHCDITDETSVRNAFETVQQHGKLTDVVHAAGVVSVGAVAD